MRWKWKLTRLLLPDENITAPLPREEKAVADLAAKLGLISDNSVCGKCVFPGCGAIAAFCALRGQPSGIVQYKFATQKLPPAFLLSATFHWQSLISTKQHHTRTEKTCGFGTFCHTWLAAKVCPLREKPSRKHAAARNSFFLMSFFPRHFSQSVSSRAPIVFHENDSQRWKQERVRF
jgi:hypothetical protein